jgi:hypothetical protein
MSILMMSKVWSLDHLEPAEKLVLLAIADFADDQGQAWPSIPTLARKSSLSKDTVRRKIRKLSSEGILAMSPRKDKTGRDTSYNFRLFPNIYSDTPQGSTMQGGGLHHAKREGSTVQPSFMNHHIEPSKNVCSFDNFWTAYPRKTGKAQALKIWQRLNPSPGTLAEILTALDWQRIQPDWQKDGGRFIPHPSTWLNGRRWEDEKPNTAKLSPSEPRRLQVAL